MLRFLYTKKRDIKMQWKYVVLQYLVLGPGLALRVQSLVLALSFESLVLALALSLKSLLTSLVTSIQNYSPLVDRIWGNGRCTLWDLGFLAVYSTLSLLDKIVVAEVWAGKQHKIADSLCSVSISLHHFALRQWRGRGPAP